MLPVLPTPASPGGPRRWLALLVAPLLALALSGCLGSAMPPRRVVLEALNLQIGLTQAAIRAPAAQNSDGVYAKGQPSIETQRHDCNGQIARDLLFAFRNRDGRLRP
jgi:hypothetical protein